MQLNSWTQNVQKCDLKLACQGMSRKNALCSDHPNFELFFMYLNVSMYNWLFVLLMFEHLLLWQLLAFPSLVFLCKLILILKFFRICLYAPAFTGAFLNHQISPAIAGCNVFDKKSNKIVVVFFRCTTAPVIFSLCPPPLWPPPPSLPFDSAANLHSLSLPPPKLLHHLARLCHWPHLLLHFPIPVSSPESKIPTTKNTNTSCWEGMSSKVVLL